MAYPSFNPHERTLSTKTMKSICNWADKNKNGKLTDAEINKAQKRLSQTTYTVQQQAQQKQQYGFAYGDYGMRYGHYLEAARKAQTIDYTTATKNGPPTGSAFAIRSIDAIAKHDGEKTTITAHDWTYLNDMYY
jgi:hypothetical protein